MNNNIDDELFDAMQGWGEEDDLDNNCIMIGGASPCISDHENEKYVP